MRFKHGYSLIFGTMITLALVGCGGGGTALPSTTPVPPVVVTPPPALPPIAVKSSSYANAKDMNIDPQTYPKLAQNNELITSGVAFADFFQEGKMSMVAFSNVFAGANGFGSLVPGKVYFFQKDANGAWTDKTARVLDDTTGCLSPRKVIVADFNGDGKPDVFAACHGIDGEIPVGGKFGEHPRMLLSQVNGTYKNVDMGFDCYCHGASAAEMNTKGYADIVVTDSAIHGQPFFLINNKNGTFTADYHRMPPSTEKNSLTCAISCPLQIYSVELIDFDNAGKFDLWLGGTNDKSIASFAPSIFKNPGNNDFSNAAVTILPSVVGYPLVLSLDIVFVNDTIYMSMVDQNYETFGIQKIDYKTLSSKLVYNHTGRFPNNYLWVDWVMPRNNKIVSLDSTFGLGIND